LSDIRVNTISAVDGVSPVALTKQSAANAYGMYSLVGTAALFESLNIASLTDSGLGFATLNLTNAMATTGSAITAGNALGSGQYLCSNVNQASVSSYTHLTQDPATDTWYDTTMHSHVQGDLA
jgi:hypothetical protein